MNTSLVFTRDKDITTVSETFGFSSAMVKKFINRMEMYQKENREAVQDILKKEYPKKSGDELQEMLEDMDGKEVDQFEREHQIPLTKTTELEMFLQTELFKSLNFPLESANDFFMLGYVFAAVVSRDGDNPVSKLKEVLEHLKESLK